MKKTIHLTRYTCDCCKSKRDEEQQEAGPPMGWEEILIQPARPNAPPARVFLLCDECKDGLERFLQGEDVLR